MTGANHFDNCLGNIEKTNMKEYSRGKHLAHTAPGTELTVSGTKLNARHRNSTSYAEHSGGGVCNFCRRGSRSARRCRGLDPREIFREVGFPDLADELFVSAVLAFVRIRRSVPS